MSPSSLRIVFFGTPEFAVPVLDALLASRHAVVGVVTRTDRPRGRGQRVAAPPIKTRALAAGLPVLQPDRLGDPGFVADLRSLAPDLGVVAAYGKLLTDDVLAVPPLGLLNVHASLLPRYRGAAPVQRAILAGERETGVTIMRVVKALDAGPMLARERRPIGEEETADEVERDLARIGARLLVSVVDALAAGPVPEEPQDERAATYAPRITRAESEVDWSQPAERLHNLIRGLHPWPHASTRWRGTRLILLRSRVEPHRPVEPDDDRPAPGTILAARAGGIDVATGRGILAITELQREGRRPMPAAEFLAGHRLTPGERFA